MKQTQCDLILSYIKNHGSITPLEAIQHIGCMRLSARIADLKKRGYNIQTELQTVPTRDGTARVARYRLETENDT